MRIATENTISNAVVIYRLDPKEKNALLDTIFTAPRVKHYLNYSVLCHSGFITISFVRMNFSAFLFSHHSKNHMAR